LKASTLLSLALLMAGACFAAAQEAQAPSKTEKPAAAPAGLPAELNQSMALAAEGKLLAAVAVLEGIDEPDSTTQQSLATLYSFVGDDAAARRAMDAALSRRATKRNAVPEGLVPESAMQAIVEAARRHRVVIINEWHHVPQHRAFIAELLPRLREAGFEYYAAETFSEDVPVLARRGYPKRTTGYYTQEPVFGQTVREAIALGFTTVAYEALFVTPGADMVDNINAREEGECRNLMARIFSKQPDARVIIHVGMSHAMETPQRSGDGRDIRWMACRLAEATGSELLTIDQTVHTERSREALATPQWRYAKEQGWLTEPIVLRQPDGACLVTGNYAGAVDLQVVHPPTKLVDGRPDWLTRRTGRVAVPVPEEIRADSERVLVEAFVASESDDAIPVDRVMLTPGEPRLPLVVPAGEYRIVVQDERGEEIARRAMRVELPRRD